MQTSKHKFSMEYKSKETEELIELYLSGDIVEEAFYALLEELSARSISSYALYQLHDLSNVRKLKNSIEKEVHYLAQQANSLTMRKTTLINDIAQKEKKLSGDGFNPIKYLSLKLTRKQLEEVERIKKLQNVIDK